MSSRKGKNGKAFENEVRAIELKYCPESRLHTKGDRRYFSADAIYGKNCGIRFEADAVLENFFGEHRDLIVEKKYQEGNNGTTMEKIPFTLMKIEEGVYGKNPHFAIVSICLATKDSRLNQSFADFVELYKETGRSNFANVHYFTNLVDYEAYLRGHAQRQYVEVKFSNSTDVKPL